MADEKEPQAPYATNWDQVTDSTTAPTGPAGDLPPVEPPSAGFIVQLFLVPALIVVVLVGVWALFGKLASSTQDWRQLVSDLKIENEHRRWRAAHGLAQVLNTDLQRGEDGEQLSKNPEIALAMAELLDEELDRKVTTNSEEALNHRMFLTRAIGLLDVHETVLPVLRKAVEPSRDLEVRKMGLASISTIAGRALESGKPLDDAATVDQLITVSQEQNPLIRQMATYALGLFPTANSKQRLAVLLENPDPSTQVNAAIGFARQGSLRGYSLFKQALRDMGDDPKSRWKNMQSKELEETRVRDFLVLKNVIQALSDLQEELTAEQREEISELLTPIAKNYPEERIRLNAGELQRELTQ